MPTGKKSTVTPQPTKLFNVIDDVGETLDLSTRHPDVVAKLTKLAERARSSIGDSGRPGTDQRPAGWEEFPKALTMDEK